MVKIIAEFCQNHNGNVAILDEMISAAAEAGATYGKIQTIFADDLTFRERFEEGRVEEGIVKVIKRPYKPEYERLKGLELTYTVQQAFVEKCRKAGLIPLTTCFTRESISRIKELGINEIKVASYDCASLPLIMELAERFDRLIISTGATFDEEIMRTSEYLNSRNKDFVFLHCVSLYPTPLEEMHLRRMEFLKQFTNHVGLSEHSDFAAHRNKASMAAIHCGAEYIERHFTVLSATESRDGRVSIDAQGLKELVAFSKMSHSEQKTYLQENVPEFEVMLGRLSRELSATELLNRDYYRGRFASKKGDRVVYNWEGDSIP